jgi:hypothetical protein
MGKSPGLTFSLKENEKHLWLGICRKTMKLGVFAYICHYRNFVLGAACPKPSIQGERAAIFSE